MFVGLIMSACRVEVRRYQPVLACSALLSTANHFVFSAAPVEWSNWQGRCRSLWDNCMAFFLTGLSFWFVAVMPGSCGLDVWRPAFTIDCLVLMEGANLP